MFEGLRGERGAASTHSFPSSACSAGIYGYLFYDATGRGHDVIQAERGEQGDPLMPGLCAVGVLKALPAAHSQLQPGEVLFAFLDDTYVVSTPNPHGAGLGPAQNACGRGLPRGQNLAKRGLGIRPGRSLLARMRTTGVG